MSDDTSDQKIGLETDPFRTDALRHLRTILPKEQFTVEHVILMIIVVLPLIAFVRLGT